MRINLKNHEKINVALGAVNGRASAFTIGDVTALADFAEAAERQLRAILPKPAWKGARVTCIPSGPSTSSYGYRAKSTQCILERGAAGWFLVGCEAVQVYPKSRYTCDVTLTAVQTLAAPLYAAKRLAKDFSLTEPSDTLSNHERLTLHAMAEKCVGIR